MLNAIVENFKAADKGMQAAYVLAALYLMLTAVMFLMQLGGSDSKLLNVPVLNPFGVLAKFLFREQMQNPKQASKPSLKRIALPPAAGASPPAIKEDEADYDLYSSSIADAELRRTKAHIGTLDKEITPSPIARGYSGQNAETRRHVRDPSDLVPDEVMDNANSGVIKGMRYFNPNTFNSEGNPDQHAVDVAADTRQNEVAGSYHKISL